MWCTSGPFSSDAARAACHSGSDAKFFHASYQDLEDFGFKHRSVQHSARQYVKGPFHTQGIESFWSMLKRGFIGTFHHWSAKHTQRYANEFACRATMRDLDTIDIMGEIVQRSVGRRLTYQELKGA